MAAKASDKDKVVGLVALILGILVLIGALSLGPLITLFAVVLIVVGILVLINKLKGSTMLGVLFLVLGILLLADFLPLMGLVTDIVEIAVGVILVIVGIMKLV